MAALDTIPEINSLNTLQREILARRGHLLEKHFKTLVGAPSKLRAAGVILATLSAWKIPNVDLEKPANSPLAESFF